MQRFESVQDGARFTVVLLATMGRRRCPVDCLRQAGSLLLAGWRIGPTHEARLTRSQMSRFGSGELMLLRLLLPRKSVVAISFLCLLAIVPSVAVPRQPEIRAAVQNSRRSMSDAQILQDLKANLDRLVAEDKFSGAVLIAKGDTILFEHAYGYADHAFNALNKVDTKFNLGSMGKMFTAVAVLQLVEQGKLSLDDLLIKDLPDYPNKEVANKITIYQLLTHTSGLGDFFGKEFADSSMARFQTLESLLPLFVNQPLLFEPGTKWSYSNAGFIVLGLVIQHVSGESYYDYVREHIFKPAGMINTDNYNTDADIPNLALGYTNMPTKMGEPPSAQRRSNIFMLQRGGSAGGGYSTVEDLFRFARALEAYKLVKREYTDMEMTGKVATGRPGGVKYAFGMQEQFLNGVRIVGHAGGAPGINSNLDMYPDLSYTVAIMSNYDLGTVNLVNERLRLELTGQELPKPIHLAFEVLNKYAGTYNPAPPPNGPPGMKLPPMIVTTEEDGLSFDLGMGGKHKFLPLSAMEFFDQDSPNARATFTNDEDGKVTGLTILGTGPGPIKATKLR
jgi:CubicO group peptidase (beta-lactamase class C family)